MWGCCYTWPRACGIGLGGVYGGRGGVVAITVSALPQFSVCIRENLQRSSAPHTWHQCTDSMQCGVKYSAVGAEGARSVVGEQRCGLGYHLCGLIVLLVHCRWTHFVGCVQATGPVATPMASAH